MSDTSKSWTLYCAFRDGNFLLSNDLLADIAKDDSKIESITGLNSDSLLHLACRHGWLDKVKHLIEEYGFATNKSDIEKQTPLHYACCYGHLDIVQYLIDHQQCDVTVTTLRNWTPLHYACRYGYMNIVEYLASLPDVIQSVDQSSVLHLTCKHGNCDILIYLMDKKGFTPNPNSKKVTRLLLTACQHDHTRIVFYLLKVVSNYQTMELEEREALFMFYCKNGLLDLLKQITHKLCEFAHAFDESGKSSIHYASQKGHTAVIQHLVEQCGCNINTPDKYGFTPLHLACNYGQNVDSVKYILSRPECNFSVITHGGSSMLHCASMTEEFDSQLMNVLTKHGASVSKEALSSIQTYCKSSELISNKPTVKSAIIACLFEITKCDPNAKNYAGFSPVQISTYPFIIRGILDSHKETKIYKWIQCEDELQAVHESKCCVDKCELDLDETASNGDSVLHMACVANKAQIAEYLLQECSFNPNIKNSAGDTPLSLALKLHTYKMLPNFDKDLTGLISLFVNDPRWNPALDKKDRDGNNLLHLACQANQQELISALEKLSDKLGFSQNSNGLLPFESLSNTNIIISYALKGSFTYTFKPGSLHQFICFCNNMESGQLELIILNESSNKINWEHTQSNFCQIGHHILHLRNHHICLLIKVCFHSNVSLQSTEPLDTTIKHPETIHSSDCNHNIFVIDIVDHLIHGSFKDNVSNEELLYTACRRNRYHFVEHLILALKCNPNLRVYESEELPIALTNKSNIMQLLIQHGAKIQLDYISKLFSLSSEEDIHPDTFRILKKSKQWYPDFVCNSNGDTALHLSARYHRYQLAHYLISEAKCDLNIKNKRCETPIQLMISIKSWSDSECMNIINALISTRVWDPNSACNSNGDTALHLSAKFRRYEVANYLLTEAKCDPSIRNLNGVTQVQLLVPYMISRSDSDIHNLIKALMSTKQWDPNSSCNSSGDTALHITMRHHKYEVAKYLLTEVKCDPYIKNKRGETPIQLMISVKSWSDSECTTIINTLISTGVWDPNSTCNSNGDTALHLSAKFPRYTVANYLLTEAKCDPSIRNLNGVTQVQLLLPLMISRSDSDIHNLIKALISTKKWDPNSSCNSNGDTALHLTMRHHKCELAKYLLTEVKCNPYIKNQRGETPIQLLMSVKSWSDSEYTNIINALISTGVWDPNSTCNSNGDTALHFSVRYHRYQLAHYLVSEAKCDPNIINKKGETPILLLISSQSWSDSQCLNIMKTLISTGRLKLHSSCSSNRDTVLQLSVRYHRYQLAHYLLTEVMCDPNIINTKGETPILLMIYTKSWSDSECVEIINALVSTGLWDPNSTCNSKGDTALHLSAYFPRYEVANYLLTEAKCDPNIRNLNGVTQVQLLLPLMISRSDSDFYNLIKALISTKKWDPNSSCNSSGDTALHLTMRHHKCELAKYLLTEVKCDPYIKNQRGETPIQPMLSVQSWSDSEYTNIINALISTRVWDPNSTCNSNGDTALHLSVRHHRYEVVQQLLTKTRSDPNVQKQNGETSIQLLLAAKSWSHLECLNIIKVLTTTGLWNPNSSCSSNGDTVLHLSARHHRYEVANYLLSKANCDPYIKNQSGETSIQLLISSKSWSNSQCLNIMKILISTGRLKPHSSCSSNGDTALHLSARHHRYGLAQYLLSKAKCDPNIKNINGEMLLALILSTWTNSECKEMIKALMLTEKWDSNSSCNSNGDTALHLSARHHRYEVAQYLLSEVKCDPNVRNINGETQVQLLLPSIIPTWPNPECKKMIKALMSTEKWNSNSSCNSSGDTALHLSARHQRNKIVHFLLSEAKCDPNISNIYDKTPLQLANQISIINDLISYGASPENVYKSSLGKSVGLIKPLPPPVKVFIIGNSGVGKSTLTEALKIETSFLVKAFSKRKRVSGVDEKTAGIVPHEFESKLYGRVTFYDFAGQKELYNSHIALLQNVIQSSSPIFLIVVNLSHSEEEIQQNIHYWLFFLEDNCSTAHSKPRIIIIGSHADIALDRGDGEWQAASKISTYIQEISQDLALEYVGMYPIDCRYPESPNMSELRSCLKDTCRILRIPNTISFNAHCFYVFLLDKFSMSVAVTVDDVRNEIEKQIDSTQTGVVNYLPESISVLNLVCDELNDRGHILFLKNNDNIEKSWVIIDKTSLLSKVTGTIFAPNDFKEHCQIAESTGVVPLSRLITNFPDYKSDSEVLIGFLTHLEYCHEIDDREVHELIIQHQESSKCTTTIESENEHYFLFPGLITLNAPRGIWKQNHNFKYHCFLIIRCTRQDQFFSSRFTQVLLLRLAFSFALIKKEVNPAIPALQRECSIWKNGIFWGEIFGMEVIVEIHPSKVILLMRCQEENILHCIAQRSSIIQKIIQCVHDFCSNIEIVESFIDPSEATEFPLKSPVSPETPQFSLQKIAETIVKSTEYRTLSVVSSTGTISLDYLLTFEPYAELGMAALKKLCTSESVFENKISDSFLKHLSRKFSKKDKLFIELFSSAPSHLSPTTSEDLFTKLQTWRDECNGTYKCLKEKLDQFSVFAGRNVLVSYLLHMHFKIPFVHCVSLTWCFHFFYVQELSAVEMSQDDSEVRDSDDEVFSEFLRISNSPEQVHSKRGLSLNSKTVQIHSKDGQINLTKGQLSSKDNGIDSKDDIIKSKKNKLNDQNFNNPDGFELSSSPPKILSSASPMDVGALTSAIEYDRARNLPQPGNRVDENERIAIDTYRYLT